MLHQLLRLVQLVAALGAVSGTAYYLLCIWSAMRFRLAGRNARATRFLPPVSILKPLKGADPQMYECFRSHCLQDYPEYEIIFGVSDPADPAVELVEHLKAEFPQRAIQLLVCPRVLGTNIKVSNLAQMMSVAKYDHLVVNDSDILVTPAYLQRAVSALADPQVGLVTCLYRGEAAGTLGSRLESLGISTDFSGGVLAARMVEGGIHFGLGSTLSFRRRELEAIGGFEALVDYLADDYQLGARIAALGLRVELAGFAVQTFLPPYSLRGFWQHQLRWARSVRDSRRWGYFGLILTFGIPWALLAVILARGAAWSWVLLGATLAVRLAMAVVVGRGALEDRHVLPFLWLIPVRDVIALLVWIASYAGHKIHWRGVYFYLKNGRLVKSSGR